MQGHMSSAPHSSMSPRTRRRQRQRVRAHQAASQQTQQQQLQQHQRHQASHATFRPAATVDSVPSATRLVFGRPLDPVLDLEGQRSRAGLGHSPPSLLSLDPQQEANQVSSDSLRLLQLLGAPQPLCKLQLAHQPRLRLHQQQTLQLPLPLNPSLLTLPCCQSWHLFVSRLS